MRLADAYLEIGRHKEAADLYESCLQGFLSDDESLKRKLLHAYYLSAQYAKCEALGLELANTKAFRDANERISLALALHQLGKGDQAKQHFEDMNRTFMNYGARLAYCEFLVATNNMPAAKELASEVAGEFEAMKGPEKKLYRDVIRQVADLQQSLGK